MKINIKDQYHPFKREIERIFSLFAVENDELIFSDAINGDSYLELRYEINNKTIISTGAGRINNQDIFLSHEIEANEEAELMKQQIKHGILGVWLKLLITITGKVQSWGILTGIRPTKLYHRLLQTATPAEVNKLLINEYLLANEKVDLLQRIVAMQQRVIPDLYSIDKEVSIYIGIPYCPTKCAYCTFPAYSIKGKAINVEQFLAGLSQEINAIGSWLKQTNRRVTTIYFGGGTPTSIEAAQLDEIFHSLAKWINLSSVREITVEAGRPDTITRDKLNILKKWQVGRISINPQTFNQSTLDLIGRHHTVKELIQKYHLAREMGFLNINMDLIIGLPGEGVKELKESLEHINELKPDSLTIHTMAFKRASYLTKNKAEFVITSGEEAVRMMEYASSWILDNHYQPYYLYRQKNILGNLENIGYSLANKESLYNILIMEEKQTIIGLGSGAVSKLVPPNSSEIIRLPNPKDPIAYIKNINLAIDKKISKLNEIFKKFS